MWLSDYVTMGVWSYGTDYGTAGLWDEGTTELWDEGFCDFGILWDYIYIYMWLWHYGTYMWDYFLSSMFHVCAKSTNSFLAGVQRQLAMGFATPRKKALKIWQNLQCTWKSWTETQRDIACFWYPVQPVQDSDEAKDSMLSDSDPCKVQYLELSFDLQNPKPQTFEHISTFLGISGLVILEALSLWGVRGGHQWQRWRGGGCGCAFDGIWLVVLLYLQNVEASLTLVVQQSHFFFVAKRVRFWFVTGWWLLLAVGSCHPCLPGQSLLASSSERMDATGSIVFIWTDFVYKCRWTC